MERGRRARRCLSPSSPWPVDLGMASQRDSASARDSLLSTTTSRFSSLLSPAPPSARSTSSTFPIPAPTPSLPSLPANSKRTSLIYDRPLSKTRGGEVSLGAWAFLFSEMIQYTQKRVSGIGEFEKRCAPFCALLQPKLTVLQAQHPRLPHRHPSPRAPPPPRLPLPPLLPPLPSPALTHSAPPPHPLLHPFDPLPVPLQPPRRLAREEYGERGRVHDWGRRYGRDEGSRSAEGYE